VISAVNFTDGGPLKVLLDAVESATANFPSWDIIVLVNRAELLPPCRATVIEFPKAKKNWIIRLWYEWIIFKKLSIELDAEVWLSLHDITPRVVATRQYVYCHNPAPFSSEHIPYQSLDKKFLIFRNFYSYLYGFFIKRNSSVIVQQSWLRHEFSTRYAVARIIVSHPVMPDLNSNLIVRTKKYPSTFFYPAFPRVFKNFELLGNALEILELDSRWRGQVIVTIDGSENEYASVIHNKFSHLNSFKFIGLQSPVDINRIYGEIDVLLFPSLLETWGLPITEAKQRNISILAVDLPYAHETVGTYNQVNFFPANNPIALASLILSLHLGEKEFSCSIANTIEEPYASSWKELFNILLFQDAQ
jgi:hypothetical protein